MKILIYIPTYNASKTLGDVVSGISKDIECEYVIVDNGSDDNSVEIAMKLGLRVIRHHHNRGYGGSQKTAFLYASGNTADVIVVLHSDNQYDPSLLSEILSPLVNDSADVVLGSRILGGKAIEGGMPYYKFISNRFLTWLENMVLGSNISEFHTGYRAYRTKVLEEIPFLFNSDNWLFDSEILFQIVHKGARIKEIPIPTSYHINASSVSLFDGIIYGIGVLKLIACYSLHCSGIWKLKQFSIDK